MVEVLAVEEALDLAVQCGWRKVGFFRDFKLAIDAITKPQNVSPWKFHAPLQKVKESK